MSKLSEKFAAGKKALAERQSVEAKDTISPTSPFARAAGPLHGSVSTMKIDLLKAEIDALKAAKPVIKIHPNEIKASAWVNRHQDSFKVPEFAAFKAEIESAAGNIQPIKVRPLKSVDASGAPKYEIVFGHRRHRACLELGIDVNAIVDDIDEKTMFVEMDRENRERADLRPFEQGLMYARALDSGLFSSLRKLSEEIGADPTNISKAVSLARLPEPILDSFESRLDIQYRWASDLKAALEKEPDLILARAADIKKQRSSGNQLSSQSAFNLLVGKSTSSSKPVARKVTVGKRVLTITELDRMITYKLDILGREKLSKIEKFITSVMAE
ncbi:MAG: ParB/RepB/Spo0J family partition protein [Xanthomonadaceae bacterium]|jgi:ParB family chromosome partitioning protein|nr:ParB/RepB/Spo0J family partition protein [Xanthomonadaceae bacterium]